jgi:anti-sigma B factor antagonist
MAHVGLKRTVTATALVIRLTGELDYAAAEQAASRLEQAAAASPPPGVVIVDLTRISYLSAAGLRAVQCFTAACADRAVCPRLAVAPGSIVQRVLDAVVPDPRVEVFGTVAEALLGEGSLRPEGSLVAGSQPQAHKD